MGLNEPKPAGDRRIREPEIVRQAKLCIDGAEIIGK
jgi:hypothetical protein